MTPTRKGKRVLLARVKVKKPRPMVFYVVGKFRETVHAQDSSLRKMRQLHNWTGRALAWLEQQEKKK